MRLDETGQEIMTLNGLRWQYYDDDNTNHEVRYEDMNNRKKFEAAVKKKGLWAWFAYTHNIGQYFYDYKQRARFLGSESAYEEDNFFYITNVPGFEGKKIAFQLRVSNHRTVLGQWENSHSNGNVNVNGNRIVRSNLMADFCLNLILNPHGRPEDGKRDPSVSSKIRICCIDCYFKYYDYPEGSEKRNAIDEFIKKIVEGERPTIDYSELNSVFGRCVTRESITPGDPAYREHNFADRENLPMKRNTFNFVEHQDDGLPSFIPFSYLFENGIEDGNEFMYKGRKYLYDYNSNCVYFINVRGKVNKNNPIPVDSNESRRVVKLSLNEIRTMVYNTLRKLL